MQGRGRRDSASAAEVRVQIRTMSEGKYAAWRAEREEIEREWREACMFGYDMAFTSRGECLIWDNGKLAWCCGISAIKHEQQGDETEWMTYC